MDYETIFTIVAAAVILLVQLAMRANKQQKAKKQAMLSQRGVAFSKNEEAGEMGFWEKEMARWAEAEKMEGWAECEAAEELDVVPPAPVASRMSKPKEERRQMAKPVVTPIKDESMEILGEEGIAADDEDHALFGFTPQKAILFSEVINPKWE